MDSPGIPIQPRAGNGLDQQKGRSVIVLDGQLRVFDEPVEIVVASELSEVRAALNRVQRLVDDNHFAIGYIAYEAAPAFDPALVAHAAENVRLVQFNVYDHDGAPFRSEDRTELPDRWTAGLDASTYGTILTRIREYIAAGDTYQVNYTFPLISEGVSDSLGLFLGMVGSQPTDFAAYLDLETQAIASVSPELFFKLNGNLIETRPMKGTAARGLWTADDDVRGDALCASPKDRAENVMIVDLLRNDLGRIAETGSVQTVSLFDVERHPTLWQMTSTVRATTAASVPEIFGALFPCGSVTGAPKIRTMEIIRELEAEPRGAYCGAIGWWGPRRQAQFSVGIRTATVDRLTGRAVYPVGSGITWDSLGEAEYHECRLKSKVLVRRESRFDLLETIAWDGTYIYLDDHLKRLADSARYFGFHVSASEVRTRLLDAAVGFASPMRVRVRVDASGASRIEAEPLNPLSELRIGLARQSIDAGYCFLYHKTTHRGVYDAVRSATPEYDDVLLWNENAEITESTFANVIARIDGQWYTPPVSSGLLPGIMRQMMLDRGELIERVIRVDELDTIEDLHLINSVRGRINVCLVDRPISAAIRA